MNENTPTQEKITYPNIYGFKLPDRSEEKETMNENLILSNEEMVFLKSFRFTLESNLCPKIRSFIADINFDLVKKTISLDCYHVIIGKSSLVYNWTEKFQSSMLDEFVLQHLDGCGNCIQAITFEKVNLVSHQVNLDYKSKDPMLLSHLDFTYLNHFLGESKKSIIDFDPQFSEN